MAKKQVSKDRNTVIETVDVLPDDLPKPQGRKKYEPKHHLPEDADAITERGDLQKFSTDGDLVDIWERRMLNPNHQESGAIRIKTPGMKIRWINLSNRGRFQRARYDQGWVPVQKDELMDEKEIYGVSFTAEGHVCRGEKQGEMLMKIPLAVYRKIQQRRGEMNEASYRKLRQNMGSAGYGHFKEKYGGSAGDQAEEAANSFVGSIKFGTEKATTEELFE
jgi:hypothetical protein